MAGAAMMVVCFLRGNSNAEVWYGGAGVGGGGGGEEGKQWQV